LDGLGEDVSNLGLQCFHGVDLTLQACQVWMAFNDIANIGIFSHKQGGTALIFHANQVQHVRVVVAD
jgi:hypothetical protein